MANMTPEQQAIFEVEFKKLNETKTSGVIRVGPSLYFQIIFRGQRVEVLEIDDAPEELPF